jgi:pimeloyl-ACP methyl ester carboxylesterase
MNRAYILLGGLFGTDGYLTSNGMFFLENRIAKIPHTAVKHYLWNNYIDCYKDMMQAFADGRNDKVILIGYSGGGAHATWIARGYDYRTQKYSMQQPMIDLLVAYDPSPQAGMMDLKPTRVKRAICYHNKNPFMFGLGGGKLEGPQVTTIEIAAQHLVVQYSKRLHDRTMSEILKTIGEK